MKSEMKKIFFLVWTCIKPNLVLSEISEMKRWKVRWRDEEMKKNFSWSEHVSSQIWCYLKLVRWRDAEMKRWRKFFWVRTCIKPNLVLSEISEMKSEMKKIFFFWSKHVSSQIWCYLELVRWRVRWRDEQMKKIFFWSEHVSSQIWCYLKLMRWRDEEGDEENFFWYEHVSSQIWCYLKLVRWRDEEWDEEIKKIFFLVWTCIKPNLVLSEISEMKRWRVKWRDEENFFWSEHVSSQIWCYLELVRWRVRWRDEQMKKIFLGLNMYQAKSGVIWN